jgi:hypothetical protein
MPAAPRSTKLRRLWLGRLIVLRKITKGWRQWLDVRYQPVAALWNGLNKLGLLGIVSQGFAKFRDGARQDIISYKDVKPDRVN